MSLHTALGRLLAAAALCAAFAGCSVVGAPRLPSAPPAPALPKSSLPATTAVQNKIIGTDTGTKADHHRVLNQLADADLAQVDGAMTWLLLSSIVVVVVGVVIMWYAGTKLGGGLCAGGAAGVLLSIAVKALEPYAIYVAIGVLCAAALGVAAHFGPRWWRHWRASVAAAAAKAKAEAGAVADKLSGEAEAAKTTVVADAKAVSATVVADTKTAGAEAEKALKKQ